MKKMIGVCETKEKLEEDASVQRKKSTYVRVQEGFRGKYVFGERKEREKNRYHVLRSQMLSQTVAQFRVTPKSLVPLR